MKSICCICREKKKVHQDRKTKKFFCPNCKSKNPRKHKKCLVCRKDKPVAMYNEKGRAICHSCYNLLRYYDSSTYEKCCKCGEVRPVAKRAENGEAICPKCYQRDKIGRCTRCGEIKVLQIPGVCSADYRRERRAIIASQSA